MNRKLIVNGQCVTVPTPKQAEIMARNAQMIALSRQIMTENPTATKKVICDYLASKYHLSSNHIYLILSSYGIQR